MSFSTPTELKKLLKSSLADRARSLAQGPRIYRVSQGQDASWTGHVLSDLQPETPEVRMSPDGVSWHCTCGDHDPCVHVLALLFKIRDQVQVPEAIQVLLRANKQSTRIKDSVAKGQGQDLDLFDEGLLQPSLFDTPGSPRTAPSKNSPIPPVGRGKKVSQPGTVQPNKDKDFFDPLGLGLEIEVDSPPTIMPDPSPVFEPHPAPQLPHEHGHVDEFHTSRTDPFVPSDRHRQPWEIEPGPRRFAPDQEILTLEPRFQLQFAETLGRTDIRLIYKYGDHGVPASDLDELWQVPGSPVLIKRNFQAEQAFKRRVTNFLEGQIAWERGHYSVAMGIDSPDWGLLCSLGDFLLESGERILAEGFEILVLGKKLLGRASLSVTLRQETDWFGVHAGVRLVEGEEASPDASAQSSTPSLDIVADQVTVPGLLATAQGYVALNQTDLRRLGFLKALGMDPSGALQTSSTNLSLIDMLYGQIENQGDDFVIQSHAALLEIRKVLDEAYRSAHSEKHDLEPDFPIPPQPAGLQATLRVYQLIGFAWLRTLHHHGFGACLADDMGLGKTMQTLALLCSLKEEGRLGPSLLVAPVVTLANWEAEIARFAPEIQFLRHQGQRRVRDAAALRACDLVIVSYQTLRNDLDLFAGHTWDYIILDEAHYIKNAGSQIFKAVRVLSGAHRLSLTGTPIENNSMELWAQFDFVNPGLLGSATEFYERFAGPIERKGDHEAAHALRETVRPFILRRKKQEVLSELPDKIETVQWIEMDTAQAQLYEAHRKRYHDIVTGLLDTQGLAQSRMEVFKYLLRLRQLAVAPVLADASYSQYASAKIDALILMLEDLLAEDNKVLIFSQFTSTLDLIAVELKSRGMEWSYLSGKTRDRQAEIDAFVQKSTRKVFLLSLKAGGVGINLVQANYVVLFDPWWNPAAENQAVDRAYRMGQKRKVHAYRFITRNTIEEKILALQGRKSNLQEVLVNPDHGALDFLDEGVVRDLFS